MSKQVREELPEGVKRGISKEVLVFILIFFGFFILVGSEMGAANMFSTMMNTAHDIAVFTAMCMCWSGYLSTHVAMMDSLKCSELTGKAIISHTIGGLCAGVAANWGYYLITLFL